MFPMEADASHWLAPVADGEAQSCNTLTAFFVFREVPGPTVNGLALMALLALFLS